MNCFCAREQVVQVISNYGEFFNWGRWFSFWNELSHQGRFGAKVRVIRVFRRVSVGFGLEPSIHVGGKNHIIDLTWVVEVKAEDSYRGPREKRGIAFTHGFFFGDALLLCEMES